MGYYLSKEGDDTNPGTKEKPWRTLERLNTANLEPGETVYLQGGTVFPGTLILGPEDSGSKGKLITITSFGTGVATIDGGTKEAAVVRSNYFRIANLNAKGAGRKEGNTANGIELNRATNGTVEQVTIEGFQHSGLRIYSCHNIEAIRVVARSNGFSGIHVAGDFEQRNGRYSFPNNEKNLSRNITLRDCVAENNPGDPSVGDNHSGSGILVEMTKVALIDRCVATNNGWDMPRGGNGPIGIWTHSSDSITIQHSISYRNKTTSNGHDGGGFALDGGVTNSIIQYCLSYENQGAGYGLYQWSEAMDWANNTVRYSISIDDGLPNYGSFSLWNGSNDSRQFSNGHIYNNLIINRVARALQFVSFVANQNFNFYNNIFIGQGEMISGTSSSDKFLGNTYWQIPGGYGISFRGHRSLQEWANASGQEKLDGRLVGLFTDPMLAGPLTTSLTDPYQLHSLAGFRLQPNSPLRDKGLDLQALFQIKRPPLDFYGNPSLSGTAPEPGVHELK
ncbi:hypothetical protein GCM10011405_39670 [Rufibacter glacialis]|uniref:right-handed parallel beta-helix repeat-containing protein n=1 Tax=Rufibacter glacialis TaxID=1259555 RepID=UPI001668BF52|nr:right-handed parallel beta-helix repeat-containing protein [Rufibacter glacialis]GGK87969.1 hypothetical protein GCM10011405_39670 [Rufibacter glacialis]